ncbi:PilW family protein [Leucothrix pacifica]|uniref:Pilus assembly protein PilW n=1 Tax=Leucothrix pacifica TaxID=1247513 RepID=A0A317CS79_9GAMM|nr:PilW family protein [Leucothrix pacifica]PWQ99172.1 hypothetical protein DKW60_07010 [Leucothrix pacifica]
MNLISPRKQTGLSLIELLVTMIIGLFITIGISSVYVGNKRSNMTSSELSQLQDNGRAVLQLLTDVIQHTAYTSTSAAPVNDMFIRGAVPTSMCSDGSDSVSNSALFSPLANNTAFGDTIGVMYMGDDKLNTDCASNVLPVTCQYGGTAATTASRIYNYFSVQQNANGVPVLMCAGSRTSTVQEIAEGVENIQFTYGEDVDSDGIADRYVNSDGVSNWSSVVSVNIAVLVRSLAPVAVANSSRSYQLSEDTIVTSNDKYLRAVFTSTVRLRNVL